MQNNNYIYLFPTGGSLRKDRSLITSNLKSVKKSIPDIDLTLGTLIYNAWLNEPAKEGTLVNYPQRITNQWGYTEYFLFRFVISQFPTSEKVGFGIYQSRNKFKDIDQIGLIYKSCTKIARVLNEREIKSKIRFILPFSWKSENLWEVITNSFSDLEFEIINCI